jgi:hypothetical protein
MKFCRFCRWPFWKWKWPWMQFSSLPINSSLQNNPRYQFSLKSENIEILPILSAAILKMAAIRSRFIFGQNILPTLLNIYAKSCGNPFSSFLYKWGQRFWNMFTAILNPKWPPKYKNPSIWKKFGFQVDYDVANWYQSLVCYGGHFVNSLRFQ